MFKNNLKSLMASGVLALLLGVSLPVAAKHDLVTDVVQAWNSRPVTTPPAGTLETGFSPDEGAEDLVLKVIRSAKKEIRLMAYSFTSQPVVEALLAAKKRGVDIKLVVDHKSNVREERSSKSRAALATLVNAGIPLRTISVYAIHHDKVIIADRETVQTGSFNYSDAAAHSNSENVLVIWNHPKLAERYLEHWTSRWNQGEPFQTRY